MRSPRWLSKTRVLIVAVFVVQGLAAPAKSARAQTCGTTGEQTAAAARASLAAAEQDASAAMTGMGFGETLPGIIDVDGAVLLGNAPVVRGRSQVLRVLAQSPYRKAPQRWQPLRVLVSSDRLLGATFGIAAIDNALGEPSKLGRYITVWRCDSRNSWQVVAHVDMRSAPPNLRVPAEIPISSDSTSPRDAFARADLDFARMAADSGAPAAFARFAAPDAITFAAGGEINVGPNNIRARMMEGRQGAQWRWHPIVTFAAASGDLGATIGEAEIRVPGAPPFYSKYLTLWQRQSDGSLKFIVDGGNARPAPR
jgi:ketosteroid isomerase-like protein